ncbi:putative neutral sphingomyelinase [Galendromus occidentalis]|uniref:sphingomyelin phosphodiesterase n=1 Tax=Galendromus occidentalis TaxID=34638 RepID=A0AAJ6VZT7_9ACAR|nr:putative neutral sphingomyelinase [Galendromus occidentalis]
MEKHSLVDVLVEPNTLAPLQTTIDGNSSNSTRHAAHVRVKALTLNLWGIVGLSKHRRERFDALAELLLTSESDIDYVFLQEVWSEADFQRLTELVEPTFRYGHYFHSGVIGSGVCLLSKWPIIDIFSYKYNLNGYAHKFHHGDWFGGKVVGMAKVQHHDMIANLYVTHLHAEYDRLKDAYLYHRVCQAFEFSQFVSHTSLGSCDYTIVAGDFNTQPEDLPYQVILYNSRLRDAFKEKESCCLEQAIAATCGHPGNTFTTRGDRKSSPEGQRIDYILYGTGSGRVSIQCEKYLCPGWKTKAGISISDHEPVIAVLNIKQNSHPAYGDDPVGFVNYFNDENLKCRIDCLQASVKLMDETLASLRFNRIFFLSVAGLLLILLLSSIPIDLYVQGTYIVLLHLARIFLSLLLGFCFLMGFLWNAMERSSILSARQAIDTILKFLQHKEELLDEIPKEKLPV